MQLKKKDPRRAGLAAATLGLLGTASPAAQAVDFAAVPEHSIPWEFDSAVLLYSESDGRVQVVEPVLKLSKDLGDDRRITTKLVLDSLTGASPNGATPASTPQTFSGPSGSGSYTTAAGETPLNDFKDSRFSLSADYQFPLSNDGKLGYGANFSKEFDFLSAGGNLKYTLDFNQRNTTLSAGLGFESDQINAVGGTPVPLSVMSASGAGEAEGQEREGGGEEEEEEGEDEDGGSGESKTVSDFVVGISQVIDPDSLVQINYALSLSSGYQNDPYKIVSVVGTDGEPLRYVYESRPDARTKHSIFGHYKRYLNGRDVQDTSYRFMTDNWGVVSHTVDAAYRWNFSDHQYLEPHLRWYSQSAADFYRIALFDGGENSVGYVSADQRLGAFDGTTVSLKYGHTLSSGNQWSARLEYYQQAGKVKGVPEQAAAGLSRFHLQPELSTVMVTLAYRFKW